ncbi:MAG: hypothetical protein ACKVT1_12170 [Dehalococcoidia bacterium]
MTLHDLVKEKLLAEGVTINDKDFPALVTWYASYQAGRPAVEDLLSLIDEPAVAFSALGVAK